MEDPRADNPYAPTQEGLASLETVEAIGACGFWWRILSYLLDSLIFGGIALCLNLAYYGSGYLDSEKNVEGAFDLIATYLLPLVATVVLWRRFGATPGKLIIRARIVDAASGDLPSVGQCIGRYVGYLLSGLPLGLGYLWIGWERHKRGWHDSLANTVVVRLPSGTSAARRVILPWKQARTVRPPRKAPPRPETTPDEAGPGSRLGDS